MPTLRLIQEAIDPSGTHRVAIELQENGSRWTATAKLRLDLDRAELERLRWYLEDYPEYPIEPAPSIAAQVEGNLVTLGRELFAQVFSDREATRLWDKVEPELASTRVEVVTDVEGATAIPWELLRDPLTNTPLVLRAAAFVRRNPQPARLLSPPDKPVERLRVLLVICRPGGRDDVPFRSVASHLVRVSDDARQAFDLDVLRPPTFTRLGQVLRAAADRGQPYHVVHFDGHGTWIDLARLKGGGRGDGGALSRIRYGDSRLGAHGYLLFEEPGARDNIRYVNGPELGDLLVQAGVPVLVLNACRSAHAELATTPEEATAQIETTPGDPHARVRAYGSLAQEVIDKGVAGVVAMRYTVYVVTAARFVGELYASLLAGQQLGEAVSRGRQHLAADTAREIVLRPLALQDWMVPIVYEAAPLPVVASPTAGQLTIEVGRAATGRKEMEAETTLPGPPEVGFYGRDETLLALDRAFDSQPVVLLHAFAGAGKTSTAAEFARWYQRTGGLAHEGGDGPVLFTTFTRHRPLALVLDQVGQVFGDALQGAGVPWGALDDGQRRQVAVQVLAQVPVLWIWDNVEPIAGFPEGTPSAWTTEEQQELRGFLAELQQTRAKVLLTSRRQERAWLGELPARVVLPPMPMAERVQLARAVAAKQPGHQLDDVEDWRPLLAYTQGNPLTITVLVGQALREGLRTPGQVRGFVARLQAGEQHLAGDDREGRTRSLGASLGYGFANAFSESERAQVSLLHLFQGFVDVDGLCFMGNPAMDGGPVEAVRGLTREQGIALLDRAAEVGLLSGYGDGYYSIHPALPWYFTELFTTAYGPPGSSAAEQATHAFASNMDALGDYYHNQYADGLRDVVNVLGAEEANLLHARQLACTHGWWDQVMGTMQGLRVLYERTGRWVEWARLVDEVVLEMVDPATNEPRPGRENQWATLAGYQVRLAYRQRDWAKADRLLQMRVAKDRERTAEALAIPPERLDDTQRLQLRSLAVSVHDLGELLFNQQRSACVDAYREALELARRIGDRPLEAIAAFNLGTTYKDILELEDLDAAERWYQHSLDLHEESDHIGRANCIAQLGSVHYKQFSEASRAGRPKAELLDHLRAAASAYQQALDLYPASAVNELAVVHNQLGLIFNIASQPDRAMRHWQESIRYEEEAGNRYGAAQTRMNIARALARHERRADALLWARAAVRDYQAYGEGAAADIADAQRVIADIERDLQTDGA